MVESDMSMAPIMVNLNKLEGTKLDIDEVPASVTFNVDVNMDESSRTNEELTINFHLSITTKPTLAKFEATGKAVITGGPTAFDFALEMDEKTSVPKVLSIIYQRVFTSLFLIASQMEVPYPPPDLIHSPSDTNGFAPSDLGLEGIVVEQQTQ
jgi:hypothetical protein